jgi:drug/metabolite transporter (DMT)-like permease
MRANHTLVGLVLGTLAVILFGASLPMTRLAVFALDPWFVTAARGALAGLIAAAVLVVLRRPIPWRDVPRLAVISFCLVVGFPGLMAVAMTTVPSGHGGVILGLLPMATAVAAVFVGGEKPSLFFWAMSALGAALVVVFSMRDGAILPVAGDLILFVAVAICGTG